MVNKFEVSCNRGLIFRSHVSFNDTYLFLWENKKKAFPFGIGLVFLTMLTSDNLRGLAVTYDFSIALSSTSSSAKHLTFPSIQIFFAICSSKRILYFSSYTERNQSTYHRSDLRHSPPYWFWFVILFLHRDPIWK